MSAPEECEPFVIYPWDPESFSFSFLYSFLTYYLAFRSTEFLLKYYPLFRTLTPVQKRNFVVYVVELFATTLLLIPLVVFGIRIYAQDKADIHDIRGVVLVAVFLCTLYLYELAFKLVIPKSLLIHHVASIALAFLSVYRYHVHHLDDQLKGIFTMFLHALTEQPTFFALILYRIKKEWSGYPMLFAAVFSLVTKTAYLAWTIQIVASQDDDKFWWYAFGPTAGLLFLSQVYGAYVLWSIYRKVKRDVRRKKDGLTDDIPEMPKKGSLIDVGLWGRKGSKILRHAKRDRKAIDPTTPAERGFGLEKVEKRNTKEEPDEEKGSEEDHVEVKTFGDHNQPQAQAEPHVEPENQQRWLPVSVHGMPQITISSESLDSLGPSNEETPFTRPRALSDRPDDGLEFLSAAKIRRRSNSTGGT